MKYQEPGLRRALAAEYVLGTLRGPARRRFEAIARRDPAMRAEQHFWERRLAALAHALPPAAPPPTVWLSLQLRIKTGNAVPLRKEPAKPVAPPPMWRIWAGIAAAVAVVTLVLVTQYRGTAPAPTIAQVPPPPAAPGYVALLKLPGSTMQWTLKLSPAHGTMTAAAAGEYPQLGSHSLELWWISPQGPVALGVLPVSGGGSMPLPKEMPAQGAITLAVSLEPPGGSPTGKPTGPVLTSGPAAPA